MTRVALCGLLFLAACQPLPHPFETDHAAPEALLFASPEVAGIVVDPVRNLPGDRASEAADALAKALQDQDIPASTGRGNIHSYHVSGVADGSPNLRWNVTDGAGASLGEIAQPASGSWTATATAIATLLHLGAAPTPPPPPVRVPQHLFIGAATGAPGDGGSALPRAMAAVLGADGIIIDGQAAPTTPKLTATVAMTPRPAGQQHVRIVWKVVAADGHQIGTVAQENDVPAGSLDGAWADAAAAIAEAGADSVAALLPSPTPPP